MSQKTNKNPILITGAIRSGTTWVGTILNFSPEVTMVVEPFNKNHRFGVFKRIWQLNYTYVTSTIQDEIYSDFKDMLEYKYSIASQLSNLESFKNLIALFRDGSKFSYWRYFSASRPRMLVKDPIAIFSAPWLVENFNMRVLTLVRHPAAFVASYLRIQEPNRFNDLWLQKDLIDSELFIFKKEIQNAAANKCSKIDEAILLWNIFHYMIIKYMDRYPHWYFLKHEEISKDPINKFKGIFDHFGLAYSEKINGKIKKYSNSKNAIHAKGKKLHQLQRNSAANILAWQARLTKDQINKIKKDTWFLSKEFYSEESWQLNNEYQKIR